MGRKEPDKQPKRRASRFLVSVLNGELLTKREFMAQLPFLFFLSTLGVFYIGYGYYYERTVKEIHSVKKEVKELRSEYITTKSELMYQSKRSQVVKATKPFGLRESPEPPKKIVLEKEKGQRSTDWK